ncbi:MAG TPA: glycosyltransferase [Candidatus Thermoplasmatota archaeon]|nr:glycosyltransferase [Candidatus Thermoplasmatota archaeon]
MAASPEPPQTGFSSGSRPAHPAASVVVTVRNEARHIADLLDSLVVQEPPFEVIVVDAMSTDATPEIVERYTKRYPNFRLIRRPCLRGGGRNLGVAEAKGDVVCFIDGDCIANPFWLQRLRQTLRTSDVAAGRTIQIGYWAFEALHRVELDHKGHDVTYPSCNLAYWKGVFDKVGGFDDGFHTAEDIDLNYRAVDVGARIASDDEAIVYHRARDTITKFIKQAYWNGYGRKQLTLKHGNLWGRYSFRRMLRQQASFWGVVRLASASFGYLVAKFRETRA